MFRVGTRKLDGLSDPIAKEEERPKERLSASLGIGTGSDEVEDTSLTKDRKSPNPRVFDPTLGRKLHVAQPEEATREWEKHPDKRKDQKKIKFCWTGL